MSGLTRDEYVKLMRELLSRDPARVREANRQLFQTTVQNGASSGTMDIRLEADMALAEIAD